MKASTKVTAPVAIVIPASIQTYVKANADASVGVLTANRAETKTNVEIGLAIGKAKLGTYDQVKAALAPFYAGEYTKHAEKLAQADYLGDWKKAKDSEKAAAIKTAKEKLEKLSGEQLSRALAIAFPGGKAGRENTKLATSATIERDSAIKLGFKTEEILSCARGNAKVVQGKLIVVKKDKRGAKNKKTPLESFEFGIGNLVTTGAIGKLDKEQMAKAFISALIAQEVIKSGTELVPFCEA
jgi:ABC-type transporter MlaC component